MKNLKWRLVKLPSPDEVRELVKDKIISQEEARDILFSQETEEGRDKDSLKEEIKFLRELINKLSTRSTIIETIKYIEKPYIQWGWYQPYMYYCTAQTTNLSNSALNSLNTLTAGSSQANLTSANYSYGSNSESFTDISTF